MIPRARDLPILRSTYDAFLFGLFIPEGRGVGTIAWLGFAYRAQALAPGWVSCARVHCSLRSLL